jgi:hypothetical protein
LGTVLAIVSDGSASVLTFADGVCAAVLLGASVELAGAVVAFRRVRPRPPVTVPVKQVCHAGSR